ncbi:MULTISPECIES: hypothetical protein [Rhodomicrobium]|uniref:hypothetical protein n=1 Tax=Rhodomicrobium TaxID=1068 RepID=UPI000F74583B|nr:MULTISPECIES: hypothetical protein [Rhodomicrobium]
MGKPQSTVLTSHARRANKPQIIKEICARAYYLRAYSGLTPVIWPPIEGGDQFAITDLAYHLGRTFYFPESRHAPFAAAQYAVELATILRCRGPLAQLHALLLNASDAYLGYVPPIARAAEMGMTVPALAFCWRDQLRESLKGRIMAALEVPDFGRLQGDFANAILYARDRLDATLERDIGAFIHRSHALTQEPLPYVVMPERWDHTVTRYLNTYGQLIAACGLPDKR